MKDTSLNYGPFFENRFFALLQKNVNSQVLKAYSMTIK